MTIRQIFDAVSDCFDFNTSHYICSSLTIPFSDGVERTFGVYAKDDKRAEMYVVLGKGMTTYKHGHVHKVYCTLPEEAVTPEIGKYRDPRDPWMYKYQLPERIFNSILNQFPVDINQVIDTARRRYAQGGYEWDGFDSWQRKVNEWFGWNLGEEVV